MAITVYKQNIFFATLKLAPYIYQQKIYFFIKYQNIFKYVVYEYNDPFNKIITNIFDETSFYD